MQRSSWCDNVRVSFVIGLCIPPGAGTGRENRKDTKRLSDTQLGSTPLHPNEQAVKGGSDSKTRIVEIYDLFSTLDSPITHTCPPTRTVQPTSRDTTSS